jgi:beta-lactamase superfamily II metal-dependent hydrolase
MLDLHVIQAEHGDCFLAEYRSQGPSRSILIDGGPSQTYANHLKYALHDRVSETGRLDLIVISHIDNDHISGVVSLLKNLRMDRRRSLSGSLRIDRIWHNSLVKAIGIKSDIASRTLDLASKADNAGLLHNLSDAAMRGFAQGDQVSKLAADVGIQVNAGFREGLLLRENAPTPWPMEDMSIWILGPNRQSLERLQWEWFEWLKEKTAKPITRERIDTSIPNLSSIMLLLEAGERRILLPGDGTGREILEGLQTTGKLDALGQIHVDILKLPHHGSMRNVSEEFLEKVTADLYVISANKDHPDAATLAWLVKSARSQGRAIKILATNETRSTQELITKFDQGAYGYRLSYMKAGQHYITV